MSHRARTTTYDDDVAAGVRAAEEAKLRTYNDEWSLDGGPLRPEFVSKLGRDDLKFCGQFAAAEEEAMRAFVEEEASSFRVPIPAPLYRRVVDRASELGVAPSELIASVLAMPLELIATVVLIKCETCGTPWVAHSPDCSRDAFRPGWSRFETEARP